MNSKVMTKQKTYSKTTASKSREKRHTFVPGMPEEPCVPLWPFKKYIQFFITFFIRIYIPTVYYI